MSNAKASLLADIAEAHDTGTLGQGSWGEDLFDIFTDLLSGIEDAGFDQFSTDRQQVRANRHILSDAAEEFLSQTPLTSEERKKLIRDLLTEYNKSVEELRQEEEEEEGERGY